MTPTDRAALAQLRHLWEATTPGTWYDHNVDDDMYMNVYAVTTSPNEPDLDSPVDSRNDHAVVVALTLLQSPRLACHASQRWAEDARFIAAVHNSFGSLLAALDAAEAQLASVCETLSIEHKRTKALYNDFYAWLESEEDRAWLSKRYLDLEVAREASCE